MKTYKIKPLKWERRFDEISQEFRAHVPFGHYAVTRHREDFEENKPWRAWRWEWFFDEYYDEGSAECEYAEDGKRLATEDWMARISPALQVIRA